MCDINGTSRGEFLGPKQAHLITMHTELGLQDKGCAIKRLVACYIVWLGSTIYGMDLGKSARCVVWSLFVVRMAFKPSTAISHRFIDKNHTYSLYVIFRKEEMKKIHSVIDKPNVNEVHDNNETSEELELDVVEHDTYKNPPSYIHENHVSVIQANQNIKSDL